MNARIEKKNCIQMKVDRKILCYVYETNKITCGRSRDDPMWAMVIECSEIGVAVSLLKIMTDR